MKNQELPPEEGFLLMLLQFAVDEWGLQKVSLQCPAHWNGRLVPEGIRGEFTTAAVLTLKIDCGSHYLTYHTLLGSEIPGFFV